jgi:D-glycero-D-manno-heptose 1,7-bisphosphate phosphatase
VTAAAAESPAGDRRAAFLDRDGVIVEPVLDPIAGAPESPYRAADVALVAGVVEALQALRDAGLALVVVSNQPAAAKGTVSLDELRVVHERAVELLADRGVELDAWHYCYHHPDGAAPGLAGPCDCRKPEPGMLLRAARELELDLTRSWMIGDSDADIEAGRRAGCRTVLVEHPGSRHRRGAGSSPDHRVGDLGEAAALIAAASR